MPSDTFQELMQQVAAKVHTLYNRNLQAPATETSLVRLRQRTYDELSAELPEGYQDFLKRTDGLYFDSLVIYASDRNPAVDKLGAFMQSFIENNLEWRSYEPHKNYLFFADEDISLYVYNLIEGRYEILDRSSATVVSTHDTFEEMISEALKWRLQDDKEYEDDE